MLQRGSVDGALIDLRMPGMDGLELLARIRAGHNAAPVAVLTAHATAHNTIEAMRLGAFDHLTKPIGREGLSRVLSAMLAAGAERRSPTPKTRDGELIGSSESIRPVQKAIGRLADSDATVLITGETGTGKELVAHRDLTERIAAGRFREDLFYRLNVVPIHLPALRERLADIVPLAEYFLARLGSGKRLTAAAAAALIRSSWPGNVRELKNAMDRLDVTVHGNLIDAADLSIIDRSVSLEAGTLDWPEEDLPSATLRLEELLIRRALARCGGNRTEAARILNIHRQMLYTKMKRLGIDVSDDKTPDVLEPDK